MSQKVIILYGVFGGDHSQARLRKALRNAGYTLVNNTAEADIVIAHSAGCLWLPQAKTHQIFLLVDPPYWPGKTIQQRTKERSHSNFRFYKHGYPFGRWLARNLWGIYYALFEHGRSRYIIRHIADFHLEQAVKTNDVIVVRNEHDEWLTPDLKPLLQINPRTKIVRLPGDHDDLHYNPRPYVSLLQSVHG